jgi:hypothetical protein
MDAVSDPLLLRKSVNAGNRTRDPWIYSQELDGRSLALGLRSRSMFFSLFLCFFVWRSTFVSYGSSSLLGLCMFNCPNYNMSNALTLVYRLVIPKNGTGKRCNEDVMI